MAAISGLRHIEPLQTTLTHEGHFTPPPAGGSSPCLTTVRPDGWRWNRRRR